MKQVATSFVDADTRIRDESALAILVQYMDVCSRDGDVVQVFIDDDPQPACSLLLKTLYNICFIMFLMYGIIASYTS